MDVCLEQGSCTSATAAEQCLHSTKVIFFPTLTTVSGLGTLSKLGGNTAGSAGPNYPKRCSIPRDIMLSSKTGCGMGVVIQARCCWETGWALVCWWEVMRFCLIFESLDVFSILSLHLLNCVYLSNVFSLFPFSVSHSTEDGKLSNWAVIFHIGTT